MKILSVDDKAENLYMLEALLRGHGHEVESASNGVDALRLAERGNFDAIISDILMPRMDGFQFCRELKKDPRLRQIPFIFYTATYTDPKDAAFALGLGAEKFLVKPVEPEVLMQALKEICNPARPKDNPPPATEPGEDEAIYLKEYNARLVAKLEKKMLDLEQANRALAADIAERERAEAERAKLERQLRQAQKMEAIGTLAGGIAHDFNNILAGIIGFAELAQQDAADPEATRQHIAEILKAGQRARELVRQILAFSRQQEQARQPLKLHHVLEEALNLLRATIPKSVDILRSLDGQAPTVLADATQVHQIITNLVTNAWHAIGDRPGRIDVTLAPFAVDADFARTHPDLRPGNYVRLTVADDGPGMDRKTLERIFEPFFTTKEPGHGTGLGLAVVHGIMRASDGAITVYSELERGTTFHLYFPALELDAPAATEAQRGLRSGRGQRILFIDDERILATLGERFLTRLGYAPTIETDPVAAIQRFACGQYDAVITDLTMPQLSGLDVGRKLLHLRPDLPIILSTGYSATLDTDRVRALGFRELLIKPYNIDALADCLHRALS
jgi:signal transduction histidine kinase/response regulator of citrate/malate metabolism